MFCSCRICTDKHVMWSLCNSRASCDTILECDRHTTMAYTVLSIASSGKNSALKVLSIPLVQFNKQQITFEDVSAYFCVLFSLLVSEECGAVTHTTYKYIIINYICKKLSHLL